MFQIINGFSELLKLASDKISLILGLLILSFFSYK